MPLNSTTLLACSNVSKSFRSGTEELTVLNDVSLELHRGESCAILGPSGSGKSTLLGICAGLDRPTNGSVFLCGKDLNNLSEDNLSRLRLNHVGFVFQNFQLIPTLTALENVLLPLELKGVWEKDPARALLTQVGLSHRMSHFPGQLSGGEQQRVALARAFVTKPEILFADEPTGNLDLENANSALKAMLDLNNEYKTTLLLITHQEEIARQLERRIYLRGGNVVQ